MSFWAGDDIRLTYAQVMKHRLVDLDLREHRLHVLCGYRRWACRLPLFVEKARSFNILAAHGVWCLHHSRQREDVVNRRKTTLNSDPSLLRQPKLGRIIG